MLQKNITHFTLAFIWSFRWPHPCAQIQTDYQWTYVVIHNSGKSIVHYSDVTSALWRLKSPVSRVLNYWFMSSSGYQQRNYQSSGPFPLLCENPPMHHHHHHPPPTTHTHTPTHPSPTPHTHPTSGSMTSSWHEKWHLTCFCALDNQIDIIMD